MNHIPDDEDPAPSNELTSLAEDLSALANENRLRLLHELTEPLYAGEISEALGMARQSALKHVDKLQDQGFVRQMHGRRESGPVKEYVTVPQRLFALGVKISELGKLQPEGGPDERREERTMALTEQGEPIRKHVGGEDEEPSRHLLIISGPEAGERFPLEGEGPRWTIGREDDRDLTLEHDPYVSAHHAEIHLHWRGIELVDAHSSNGTQLNFKRIPTGGRVPLSVGDVVGVGHTQLVYQVEEPAGPEDA